MTDKPPAGRPPEKRGRGYYLTVFVLFLLGLGAALFYANGLVEAPHGGDINSERTTGGGDVKPQN